MNKVHFKMFKAGKKWMVAGIATVAMSTGAFFLTTTNANADVVANANTYVGTPYAYGGTDASGIDCSGLVQAAYAQDGISLPRTSGAQYGVTTQESAADALPGDLVFFGNYGSDHVGIYSGNGNMVDAETTGVTNQRVSLMESVLGQASYGRVNGATRQAFDSSSVNAEVASDPANDNAQASNNDASQQAPANDASQNNTSQNNTGSNTNNPQPAADNSQVSNNDASQKAANNDSSQQQAPTTNNAQTSNTVTTDAPAAPVTDNAFASNNDNKSNDVQNDNVVALDNTVNTKTNAATSTPAATASNQKDTLPATGVKNNSFLSAIGLVFISLAGMFGIKLRKNN